VKPPTPRGALGEAVVDAFVSTDPDRSLALPEAESQDDAVLALWTLQELSYRGFDGVDDAWEWHPDLVTTRVGLERDLEARLRERWPGDPGTGDVVADLAAVVEADDGPSLARHLQRHGTREQALDLLRQRSVYHLKEADPTAWVVPRLDTSVKAALVEIQFDEYGAGRPDRLHHELFARGMAASGLDPTYGGYVDEALPEVLEQNTALTMFGLHRRLRGAAVGHFAVVEATSSLPSRQLAQALRGVGLAEEMAGYYDEHVEADAVHEQLAARDVCGVLVEQEPELHADVLFGAWTCADLEARTARAMLDRWAA